jgi:two-component system phosphate regulon sensor histidine kinase PhoR
VSLGVSVLAALGAGGAVLATGADILSAMAASGGAGGFAALHRLFRPRGPERSASASSAAAPLNPSPRFDSGLPPGLGRELLDRLPMGLLLLDAGGRVVYENAAALDVIERPSLGLQGAAALRAPALAEALTAALSERREAEVDATLLRGKERVVRAFIRPLPQPGAAQDASSPAVLVLFEDRTRAAKAEALRQDFVANASHELRTPLASITGFIETLQGHAKDDPAATEQFLRIMAVQAERMKRLIDDLLSLNRIEINEHVQPRDVVDVADTVREVVSALAPVAANEGARVEVALPETGLRVRGSADELAQVFVNLIDNAVKYAGVHGPIRIALEAPNAARPGMLGVTVADCGPGIPREHLPRLTERFYRVNAARSRERGGTGLGLAIAKHIMNRHRGELTVTSAAGQGSRFTVWLPILPAEAAEPAA